MFHSRAPAYIVQLRGKVTDGYLRLIHAKVLIRFSTEVRTHLRSLGFPLPGEKANWWGASTSPHPSRSTDQLWIFLGYLLRGHGPSFGSLG